MTVKFANRTRHLVVVPLNSGGTIHLAPDEISHPVEELEIQHNSAIEKLVRARLIVLSSGGSDPHSHSSKSMEPPRRKERR
jgi:hypothetical protein